jgi:AraC-like DNA-binding protein
MEFPDLQDSALRIVSPPFIHRNEGYWHWNSCHVGHWNLWICQEGLAKIRCDGLEYSVRPWTAFLFSDNSIIEGRSLAESPHIRNFSIHLSIGLKNQNLLRGRLLGIQLFEVDAMNSLINSAIRLSALSDPFATDQLKVLTMNLIGLLWRASAQPIQTDVACVIYQQMDRIHAGQDMFRSVDEFAAEANLSRMHYTRCFRQLIGDSPNRYLIQKRIERACTLLRQTDWSIEAVAQSIGYADIYFFCRQFRKIMEVTPTTYRKQFPTRDVQGGGSW